MVAGGVECLSQEARRWPSCVDCVHSLRTTIHDTPSGQAGGRVIHPAGADRGRAGRIPGLGRQRHRQGCAWVQGCKGVHRRWGWEPQLPYLRVGTGTEVWAVAACGSRPFRRHVLSRPTSSFLLPPHFQIYTSTAATPLSQVPWMDIQCSCLSRARLPSPSSACSRRLRPSGLKQSVCLWPTNRMFSSSGTH